MLDLTAGALDAHTPAIGLFLLIALLIAFMRERMPPVVIATAGAIIMLALGLLSPDEMLDVFANPAPITIAAMFVLSGALLRTGTLEAVSGWVIRRTLRKPRLAVAEVGAGTMFASAFMNNTPVVIVMIPILKRLSRVMKIPATRLLIPLSYLTILGGTLTLIGTSTNLLVDGIATEQGLEPFGMFEITPIGLAAAAGGLITLLVLGPFLLPTREPRRLDEDAESDAFLSHLALVSDSPLVGMRIGDTPIGRRAGIRVLGVTRGNGEIDRRDPESRVLQPGDQLVIAASPAELASLAEAYDFRAGLTGVGGDVRIHGPDRPEDLRLMEAVIGPSHPAIGRRLADIPMLSRLHVRVLGLSRPRHVPGPELAEVRCRAGDRLLIAAGDDAAQALQGNINFTDVSETPARAFRRAKAPVAIAVLAAVVLASVAFGWPIHALALAGVGVVLVTRCIEPEEAWSAIEGNTMVLIFAMLAFGRGLDNAGTVELLVDSLRPLISSVSPLLVLVMLYALTSILTEMVTNNAVAVILTPLAIGLAEAAGINPRVLVMAVMFGASASFATPIGYQTNTLVYGAANYRFTDFLKIGVPMNITVGAVTCLALSLY
jgi:di/tricarboxylate transporter